MCKKGSGRRKRELTEPNIRSECVDGSKEELKKKRKSEGRNRCTRLQAHPLDGHSTSAGSKTQRERGPEEEKCPSQTKQEGARDISTSERTGSSERPSEMGSVSVRSIAMGCGG